MKLKDSTEILEVKISDVKTDNELVFYERPDRKQHFIKMKVF